MGVLRKNDVPSLLKGLFVASCVSEAVYLLYMSLCNRDLELIGSFRPVIPVIHYIRNYIIRDMLFCLRRAAISVWGYWGLTL